MSTYNPLVEARELREQLSSDKRRVAFLFGAGTSQAVGIDGIVPLTGAVAGLLPEELAKKYRALLSDLGTDATVEHVLDKVRLCRELFGGRTNERAFGLSGAEAVQLDQAVCRAIHSRVSIEPPKGLGPYVSFAAWVRSIARTQPVEIFTTNYDVLIERGLEDAEAPHFDGFVGSYQPHFSPASVEAEFGGAQESICPPRGWVRVWKLHGSIGWRVRQDGDGRVKVVRAPHVAPVDGDDVLIYPSQQKYADSRKQPYVALHDRLRRLLLSGETLLVTAGYAFGDQHINEIIFQGLRANNRLAVTALMYGDLQEITRRQLLAPAQGCLNLTMYAADQASIRGVLRAWGDPGSPPTAQSDWPFWDAAAHRFTLGDFAAFTAYLRTFLGVREHVSTNGSAAADGRTPVVAGPANAVVANGTDEAQRRLDDPGEKVDQVQSAQAANSVTSGPDPDLSVLAFDTR